MVGTCSAVSTASRRSISPRPRCHRRRRRWSRPRRQELQIGRRHGQRLAIDLAAAGAGALELRAEPQRDVDGGRCAAALDRVLEPRPQELGEAVVVALRAQVGLEQLPGLEVVGVVGSASRSTSIAS
jgi:hypothetical protein